MKMKAIIITQSLNLKTVLIFTPPHQYCSLVSLSYSWRLFQVICEFHMMGKSLGILEPARGS